MNTMLSWQGECGCFRIDEIDEVIDVTGTLNRERAKGADNTIQTESEKCSVHLTSAALGALAMHLRYFGDTCMRNY